MKFRRINAAISIYRLLRRKTPSYDKEFPKPEFKDLLMVVSYRLIGSVSNQKILWKPLTLLLPAIKKVYRVARDVLIPLKKK